MSATTAAVLVVLQKAVEDRKLLEGIIRAAIPKILAMTFTHFLTAPFSTFFTCPFLNMLIISYPFSVRLAVLNELDLFPSLTDLFINL